MTSSTKKHAAKCSVNSNVGIPKSQKDGSYCDCDGYHTFNELYDHRITLYIALCKQVSHQPYSSDMYAVWRSKRHSDGSLPFSGLWFVLGIGKGAWSQITYHLPIDRWNDTNFAETLEKAPDWDGHTSDNVLARLKNL